MKRKLFTGALLTTVVVGAALFTNAQSSNRLAVPAGTFDVPCSVESECNILPGTPCTNAQNQALFTQDGSTGNCVIPLNFQ